MKNCYFTLLLIFGMSFSCFSQSEVKYFICRKLNPKFGKISDPNIHELTSPADLQKALYLNYYGVMFTITLNNDSIIEYIAMHDSKIQIDSLKIGLEYSLIDRKKIKREGMIPGWGYSVELKSGWSILFGKQDIINTRRIYPDSRIDAFYIKSYCQ